LPGRAARCLASLIAAALAGCSIHPVQQEATGVKTPDLVQFIRCETRLAIQDKAIQLLADENSSNPIIEQLRRGRGLPWPPGVRARLQGTERAIYDKYIQTGIAYDFSFDITEDNGASGAADPVKFITNGSAGIGLLASGDFKRQNIRHFIVSETAKDLLENRDIGFPMEDGQRICASDYRSPNYAYPIAGKIGIDELISTFFDLNEIRNLSIDKSNSTVFADQLTFTTTLSGSVAPHVIVAPAGNGWGLLSPASITAGGSRLDKHALIIGLSLDTPKGTSGRAAAAVVPGGLGRSALQRGGVRSPTEQSALDAVTQSRLDSYLDRAFR